MAVYSIEPIRSEFVSRFPHEGDSWDRGDTVGQLDGWRVLRFRADGENKTSYPGMSSEAIIGTEANEVFVVYANYDTGDTFGRDGNQIQILDIFEDFEQAVELREAAGRAKDFSLDFGGKHYYIAWNGYFESLNSINIDRVSLHNYTVI